MTDRPKVLIFGGGVGGLTAAHELGERNFDVTVFEARHWGGKVRSMGKPGTGKDGRKDLPGEHGFHFFPSFYNHIPDTMRRIPFGNGSVFDNLVLGTQEFFARTKGPQVVLASNLQSILHDLVGFFKSLRAGFTGIPLDELEFFLNRALTFMNACDARRIEEYDNISWADFIEAGRMGPEYQQLLSRLPALLLIGVHPATASARTLGNACMLMFQSGVRWTGNIERSLNGPPSDKWADPWVDHVSAKAQMLLGYELIGFDFDPRTNRISGARVRHGGDEQTVHGDYYICAVPVEAATPLITAEMRTAAPSLAGIPELTVSWMNGLQYFLDRPLPLVNGHVGYEDSAWAITSISQSQFWKYGLQFSDYGNGNFQEVLSVIISDWDTPGTEVVKKPASQCSPSELFDETLAQMNAALSNQLSIPHDGVGIEAVPREAILDWFLDPDIQFPFDMPQERGPQHVPVQGGLKRSRLYTARQFSEQYVHNAEPLYITTVGAWRNRPEATTEIPNFFIASDYVKTVLDLASAEGANEAGRKAANGVLKASRSNAPPARTWPLQEIEIFAPAQLFDSIRFHRGESQAVLPDLAQEIIRRVLSDKP